MLIMFHSFFIRTKIILAASVLVSSIQSFLLPEYVLNLFPSPIPMSTALWRPLSSAFIAASGVSIPSLRYCPQPARIIQDLASLEVCDSWIRNRALVCSGCCWWSGLSYLSPGSLETILLSQCLEHISSLSAL